MDMYSGKHLNKTYCCINFIDYIWTICTCYTNELTINYNKLLINNNI